MSAVLVCGLIASLLAPLLRAMVRVTRSRRN
jgi:hypothetical protein